MQARKIALAMFILSAYALAAPVVSASYECTGVGDVRDGPGGDDDEMRHCFGISSSGDRTCVGTNNEWVREDGTFADEDCQGVRV